MKDIDLYAIDRNWKHGFPTAGIDATVLNTKGDFQLVKPPWWSARNYLERRSVSVVFDNLHELIEKLKSFKGFDTGAEAEKGPIESGQIKLLVIICHGAAGILFVDGVDEHNSNPTDYLTSSTIPKYSADLTELGKYLASGSTVRCDGCNAAYDPGDPHQPRGTDLLISLSKFWLGVKVIAFRDFGIGLETKEAPFLFSGAEDSDMFPQGTAEPEFTLSQKFWGSYRTENSPNAKVAQDGHIVKAPVQDVLCPLDHDFVSDDQFRGHCGAKASPSSPGLSAPRPVGIQHGRPVYLREFPH